MRSMARRIATVWAVAALIGWCVLAAWVLALAADTGAAQAAPVRSQPAATQSQGRQPEQGPTDAGAGAGADADAAAADAGGSGEFGLEARRSTPQTSLEEVSRTVRCPSCDGTLDGSDSQAADRMRVWIREAIAAGWTKQEIRRGLVGEYGGDESILAEPDRQNWRGALAWGVPGVVALIALMIGGVSLQRWRRSTPSGGDER